MAFIGDNSGGVDVATQVKENLAEKFKDLSARSGELAGMADRLPAAVDNEDDANKISTAIRQCSEYLKLNEGSRIDTKSPYLAAERAVDGFFAGLAKPVAAVKATLERIRTRYDVAVHEREMARLEAERRAAEAARKAAEEAARKLALDAETAAQQAMADHAAALAEVKAVEAEEAREAMRVKPAELTRTRTSEGVTTSLRSEWKHEIITAAAVPREYCSPDERLLRAAVKAATLEDGSNSLVDKDGNSLVPGVRIYLHKHSRVM